MESQPATKASTSRAGDTPLHRGLPEEIVLWEILVRLSPKSLLRCRAVCRATSTRPFLQAHHARQPCLPIVVGSEHRGAVHQDILAFDHRAGGARLQPVARLDDSCCHLASCDGLLVLSRPGVTGTRFSVCNPATRQHAAIQQMAGFSLWGMYLHCPTGEYRLLLRQAISDKICCYVWALGSAEPPRYIRGPEVAASACLRRPALVRDSLHWYPVHFQRDPQQRQTASKVIIVFDTTSESFRLIRAPVVLALSDVFEMDDTLGIYSHSNADAMQTVDIWMLQSYESEVWRYKCRVELPVAKIMERFVWFNYKCSVSVHSVDGDVLLLVNHGGWMFYVDIDGKLADDFHRDSQHLYDANKLQLKQTLVQHTFFTTIKGYDVNASPFV